MISLTSDFSFVTRGATACARNEVAFPAMGSLKTVQKTRFPLTSHELFFPCSIVGILGEEVASSGSNAMFDGSLGSDTTYQCRIR